MAFAARAGKISTWWMDGSEAAYDSNTMTDRQTILASSPVSLAIPCRPEYVALCRLVVGALGVRDSLDEEVVADLKVIVTEACNCFMSTMADGSASEKASDGGCSIRMDFDSRPDAFVISVLYPERSGLVAGLERCGPTNEAGLGLTILRALADEMVEIDAGAEGTVLRLTKSLHSIARDGHEPGRSLETMARRGGVHLGRGTRLLPFGDPRSGCGRSFWWRRRPRWPPRPSP